MDLSQLLDAPDSALLVAIAGEVELLRVRHETPNRLTIERFPLGPVANVNAVRALLDLPVEAEVVRPAPQLVDTEHATGPAVSITGALICPECRQGFEKKQALSNHRNRKHGVAAVRSPVSTPGEYACSSCDQTFAKQRALSMHRYRVHNIRTELRREPVSGEHACSQCDARFETPLALDMHTMKMHHRAPAHVAVPPADVPAPPVSGGTCTICGTPWGHHARCEDCGVGTGRGHETEKRLVLDGGTLVCRDCAEQRARVAREQRTKVAAAAA